jgi:transketolase
MRDGRDVAILATGGLLVTALGAADALARLGISTRVLSVHTIKPLDVEAVLQAAAETEALVTLEEHSVIGGLGGAVAEVVLEAAVRPRVFKRIGVADSRLAVVGDRDYLRACVGLDVPSVTATIRELLRAGRESEATLGSVTATARRHRFATK